VSIILLAALSGSGDAAALEPLIVELQRRGHAVQVLSDPAAAARIEALGAGSVPVADPALPSLGQRPASPLDRLRRLRPTVRAAFLDLRLVAPLSPVEIAELPDWWDPRSEPPVVVVHADGRLPLEHVVVPAIEALQHEESVTIVSGALRDDTERAYGGPLPSNVHFEPEMPWSRSIPGRTMFVSTGDSVQMQHALRVGVPVVVSGASKPQLETKARVTWAGAGIDVPEARATSAMFADAIARVRADSGMHRAAALIAAQIDRTSAEQTIGDLVEELAAGERCGPGPEWSRPARSVAGT
jgi:UDP:flavonoid glycosyltransferase YjiC (YdhE family)